MAPKVRQPSGYLENRPSIFGSLMDTSAISIRRLQPADNATMATIIRRTLEEFGANHPGTVYYDEETDRLSEVFETPGSWCFVATLNGEPVGGAGVFPTSGLPDGTVELVKKCT
jgi:putative acetyltransferase